MVQMRRSPLTGFGYRVRSGPSLRSSPPRNGDPPRHPAAARGHSSPGGTVGWSGPGPPPTSWQTETRVVRRLGTARCNRRAKPGSFATGTRAIGCRSGTSVCGDVAKSEASRFSGRDLSVHRLVRSRGLAFGDRNIARCSGQMRILNLVDVVWPRGSVEFSDILCAVIDLAGSRSDFLSIRDRSAWGLRSGLLGLRRRTLSAPEAVVFGSERSGLPRSAELAQIADFPQAFGS